VPGEARSWDGVGGADMEARAGGRGAADGASGGSRRHTPCGRDVRRPADGIGAGGIRAAVEGDEYANANSGSCEDDENQANDP